jgi:hydrogenase maturation protein HypF
VAALVDAGERTDVLAIPFDRRSPVEALVRAGAGARATGAGRWFDAVAALCGVGLEVSYDGQAPRELEALASGQPAAVTGYPFGIVERIALPFELDLRPAIRAIAADRRGGRPVAEIAAAFHETMAEVVRAGCLRARGRGAPSLVALGGGCFANRRLTERTLALLQEDGFTVLLPERVPAGDGGLAYGQAAVASFRLAQKGGTSCA